MRWGVRRLPLIGSLMSLRSHHSNAASAMRSLCPRVCTFRRSNPPQSAGPSYRPPGDIRLRAHVMHRQSLVPFQASEPTGTARRSTVEDRKSPRVLSAHGRWGYAVNRLLGPGLMGARLLHVFQFLSHQTGVRIPVALPVTYAILRRSVRGSRGGSRVGTCACNSRCVFGEEGI
jgi:hypothetical protein